jgi:hypothetical protein
MSDLWDKAKQLADEAAKVAADTGKAASDAVDSVKKSTS